MTVTQGSNPNAEAFAQGVKAGSQAAKSAADAQGATGAGTGTATQPQVFTIPGPGQQWTKAQRDQFRQELRNAVRDGNMPVINVPPDLIRNAVPQGAVDISIAFFVTIGMIIVGLPLARAFARRMDARSQRLASGAAELRPAIESLQQSVDAMALELERITEAQRFQSKLMAGRAEAEPARLP